MKQNDGQALLRGIMIRIIMILVPGQELKLSQNVLRNNQLAI